MRNSVYKVLTAIILLGLLIPVAIPQGTVQADGSVTSVTLIWFKNSTGGACGDTGTPLYIKSGGIVTCNVTVNVTENGTYCSALNLYSGSTLVKQILAACCRNITAPSEYVTFDYMMPSASELPAGSYTAKVAVGPYLGATVESNAGTIIIDNTAPTAPTLASPANGAYSSTATPTFQWTTVSDAAYYTLVIDGTDNRTCLTGYTATPSAAMTKASHTWTVKSLDAAGNSTTAAETRTICIDTDAPSAPSNSSWPGDGLTFTYSPTCNWTASTDTSTCTIIRYVVETSTSSSQWDATTVVDNVTVGTNSYTRNAVLPAGTYYWRVRAYDSVGNLSSFSDTKSYTIAAGCTSFTISLNPGWNLISLPLTPDKNINDTIFNSSDNMTYCVDSIYTLSYPSACSGSPSWAYWSPDRGAIMSYWDPCKAYWIYARANCSFTVTGTPCIQTVRTAIPTPPTCNYCYSSAYPDGWNLLGFKSCQPMKASDYLSNLTAGSSTAWSSLWRWAGTWVQVQPTDNLVPGTGYYIRMNASGSVIPPCY